MSSVFFKDKSFSEASQPNINPKNNFKSILESNKKGEEKFDAGSQEDINSSQECSTVFRK